MQTHRKRRERLIERKKERKDIGKKHIKASERERFCTIQIRVSERERN